MTDNKDKTNSLTHTVIKSCKYNPFNLRQNKKYIKPDREAAI